MTQVKPKPSPNYLNDCHFFYNSTCTKGKDCKFRHSVEALGSEQTCRYWKRGLCTNLKCHFRHMKIELPRSKIPCYHEDQPGGCLKLHCVFKHKKARNEEFYDEMIKNKDKVILPTGPEKPKITNTGNITPRSRNQDLKNALHKIDAMKNIPSPAATSIESKRVLTPMEQIPQLAELPLTSMGQYKEFFQATNSTMSFSSTEDRDLDGPMKTIDKSLQGIKLDEDKEIHTLGRNKTLQNLIQGQDQGNCFKWVNPTKFPSKTMRSKSQGRHIKNQSMSLAKQADQQGNRYSKMGSMSDLSDMACNQGNRALHAQETYRPALASQSQKKKNQKQTCRDFMKQASQACKD